MTQGLKATDRFAQSTGGAVVLLGLMFLSLPLVLVGLALVGVGRWISRTRTT